MKTSRTAARRERLCAGILAAALIMASATGAAAATTYHDEVVQMPLSDSTGYTIVKATYTIESFSITDGQDTEEHIKAPLAQSYEGNKGSLSWSIGRQPSSDVATWFTQKIGANENTFGHDPSKLDFAFLGTLELILTGGALGPNQDTYVLKDIALAQGHDGASYNWWFGGPRCKKQTNDNVVMCPGVSTAPHTWFFYFKRGGNDANTVDLTEITPKNYDYFSVQQTYVGEDTSCTSHQPNSRCPPFVIYYKSSAEQKPQKLSVKGGLLYNSQDQLFDTSGADEMRSGRAAIFVMDMAGAIYASNVSIPYLLHHSSLLGGARVASAGEIVVKKGAVQKMSNCSGHYLPSPKAYSQLVESLHRQGYTLPIEFQPCKRG